MTKPFHAHSTPVLRLAGAGLEDLKFTSLVRPDVPYDSAPTKELVDWAVQLYSFSLLSQLRAVLGGVISLVETHNIPALRILVRALFEMGAHSCYVKKHVTQYLEANHLEEAWGFLLPLGTSTLYPISPYPEESQLFPSSTHIDKVIRCFNEIMEGDALESLQLA
ncbi:MAG: hypothetical protein ACYDCD_12180 [Candidatus Acidiferrales bacterium]